MSTHTRAEVPSRGTASAPAAREIPWVPAFVLLALVALLYWRVAIKLVTDWIQIPDYSHGLLIPFFVAFLLWDNRAELARTPIRPRWAGIALVAVALFTLIVGVFGADLFFSRISFVLLTAGAIWALAGVPMLRQTRFLLFVMLLAIPLPAIVLNRITFPLQLLASKVAGSLLPVVGVPVLREGNIIELAALKLEVAEACSGIRSLMSLFTVAVIYGYFMEKSVKTRVLLALASLPIAVAANAARIFGTGICVQYWDPDKAMGFFHEFSGWLIFIVSLMLLYMVHTALRWFRRSPERAA